MWNTNPNVLNTDFKVMIMGDSCRNINLPKGDIPPFFIFLFDLDTISLVLNFGSIIISKLSIRNLIDLLCNSSIKSHILYFNRLNAFLILCFCLHFALAIFDNNLSANLHNLAKTKLGFKAYIDELNAYLQALKNYYLKKMKRKHLY